MATKKYYSCKKILETGAEYLILLGMKGNGKSYSVKEYFLEVAYNEKDPFTGAPEPNYQFAYFRRWDLENKAANVEQYFSDLVYNSDGRERIREITHGEYSAVCCWQKKIYFCNYDEDGKVKRGKLIGYTFAVSRYSKYSSLAYPLIGRGVYEEFVTNEGYLPDEARNFVILVSTIFRHRDARIFMIGNTLNRENPFFGEFGLVGVPGMKQGEIHLYNVAVDEETNLKVAVENCEKLDVKNKLIIGRAAKMITTGQWDSDPQPHLPEPLINYKVRFTFFIETELLTYMGRILQKRADIFLYICPHTKEIRDRENTRILGYKDTLNYLHSKELLTDKLKYDLIISESMRLGRVVYSDNLTGTEFKRLMKTRGYA